MDGIFLVIFGWLLGLATAVFGGVEQVRVLLHLAEPEPYYTMAFQDGQLRKDRMIGPAYIAEVDAGNQPGWQLLHLGPAKVNEGYEYLRTGRRRVVYRSKTMAHGDDHVLMVRRS